MKSSCQLTLVKLKDHRLAELFDTVWLAYIIICVAFKVLSNIVKVKQVSACGFTHATVPFLVSDISRHMVSVMCEFPVLQCMLKDFCDHLWTDRDFTFHIVPRFACDFFFLPLLSPHFDKKRLFLHFHHCFSNHTKQSELPDIFQQLLCAVEFCWLCYHSVSKYFDAVVITLLCLFFFHTLSELRVA